MPKQKITLESLNTKIEDLAKTVEMLAIMTAEGFANTATKQDLINLEERVNNRMDNKFGQVDERFEQVDRRFEQVDKRFEQIEQRFVQVDERFEQIDKRFEQIEDRFVRVDAKSDAIIHKLDTFTPRTDHRLLAARVAKIEKQLKTN